MAGQVHKIPKVQVPKFMIQETKGMSMCTVSYTPSPAGLMVFQALEKSKNVILTVAPGLSGWE